MKAYTALSFGSESPGTLQTMNKRFFCLVDASPKEIRWLSSEKETLAKSLPKDNKIYKMKERSDYDLFGLNDYSKALEYCRAQGARLPLSSEIISAYKDGSVDFTHQKYFSYQGYVVDFSKIGTQLQAAPSTKGTYVRCVTDSKTRYASR